MRSLLRCSGIGLGILLSLPAAAQNPLEVDAAHFKVEYEDARVRVLRFRLMPGATSPMHEHATRITVVVSGSRLRVSDTEGAVYEMTVYTGAAERQLATRHTVENIGDQPYEELTTEFKDAASQPPKLVVKSPPPAPKPEKAKKEAKKEEKKREDKKVSSQTAATVPAPAVSATPPSAKQPAADTKPTPDTKTAGKAAPSSSPSSSTTTEVAKAASAPDTAAVPPAPVLPEPIIKPLKVRPPETLTRKMRKAYAAESMSEASVNNTRLAFMEQGKGTPVVLVHGAMGDYRSWQQQIPALAKSYRVIAYSRRYHFPNPSTGKEEDYTYEANIKDLTDFLAALNVGPVHLVAHGYGAAVAAMLAERRPELVRSLTLSEPAFENLLDAKRAYRARWARDEIYNVIRKPLTKANPEKGVQVYHDWLAET
ncbi:MAG: alpha/beta fold hydrolase, partial [Terriglobales bacterium]